MFLKSPLTLQIIIKWVQVLLTAGLLTVQLLNVDLVKVMDHARLVTILQFPTIIY